MAATHTPTDLQRATALIHDCWKHEPRIRCGKTSYNVFYLYFMPADAGLDTILLQWFKDTSKKILPPYLIGTVAKISEVRRHIANLRRIPAYQDAVIAIRIWNPFDAGQLRWDTPLELEEGQGPIAILADTPVVVNGVKVPRLEIHPRSRLGRQYFANTRNEVSTNIFISNVGFFETPTERRLIRVAAFAGAAIPTVGGAKSFHSLTTALDFGSTAAIACAVGALAGLFAGVRFGSSWLGQTIRSWLRRKKDYATGQDPVFMRRDLFERLDATVLQGRPTGRAQPATEGVAIRAAANGRSQPPLETEGVAKKEEEA